MASALNCVDRLGLGCGEDFTEEVIDLISHIPVPDTGGNIAQHVVDVNDFFTPDFIRISAINGGG